MSPRYLTASMQVLRAHQRVRVITVDDARGAVLEVADRVAAGNCAPQTERLVTKLEQTTGVTLSELVMHAQQWRDF
jgi:hypothetical protein